MSKAHAFRNLSSSETWLNCAEWAVHKKKGTPVPDQDMTAADRGTKLHSIAEAALRKKQRGAIDARGLDDHDADQVEIALRQAWSLIDRFPDAQVGLEVPVTLTYEPESRGHVDLMVYSAKARTLVVADKKFGVGDVTVDSTQVRGYASMAVASLEAKGAKVDEVVHAIIQPATSDIVKEKTARVAEVRDFRAYVEETVRRQESGSETRPAADLTVCRWCPFKLACKPHMRMLGAALDDAEAVVAGTVAPQTLERFYAGKGTIESALKLAREAILADPATFPKWTRSERKAPRRWDWDKRSEIEIIDALVKAGLSRNQVLTIKTPAKVLSAAGDGFTLDESLLDVPGKTQVLTKARE